MQGLSALVPAKFVSDVEAFFDGYAVLELGVPNGAPRETQTARYESFRVYARDLKSVIKAEASIEDLLDVIVRSRSAEIKSLLNLFRNVEIALGVVVACAVLGLAAAMTALFWANVERKRMALAILALLGTPPRRLAMFPVAQSLYFALIGSGASLVLFAGGAAVLNAIFRDAFGAEGEASAPIAPFDPFILISASLLIITVALFSSIAAARQAAATDPSIAIRAGA